MNYDYSPIIAWFLVNLAVAILIESLGYLRSLEHMEKSTDFQMKVLKCCKKLLMRLLELRIKEWILFFIQAMIPVRFLHVFAQDEFEWKIRNKIQLYFSILNFILNVKDRHFCNKLFPIQTYFQFDANWYKLIKKLIQADTKGYKRLQTDYIRLNRYKLIFLWLSAIGTNWYFTDYRLFNRYKRIQTDTNRYKPVQTGINWYFSYYRLF